jgi:hypothetical protein
MTDDKVEYKAYMVETGGNAFGYSLFSTLSVAMDYYRNAPLPVDQFRVLWQGQFSQDEHGLVYSHGEDPVQLARIEGKPDKDYLGIAVALNGTVFAHPADNSPEAENIHRAAISAGNYPYTHVYKGDNVLELIDEMQLDCQENIY